VAIGRNHRNQAALLASGHELRHAFTIRELHIAAQQREPNLGLSTAYRAVDRWKASGLVEDAGNRAGEALYLLCAKDDHHHHIVCTDCGAVSTQDGCILAAAERAAAVDGFQLDHAALATLPGRCPTCATGHRH
jgi:Fur family ferric uptake transcriptional regulator